MFSLRVTELCLEPLVSLEELEDMWPAVESARKAAFCGDSADVAPAGFIQVLFVVEDTSFFLAAQCPIYRASHHADDAPPNEEMIALFGDMSSAFITSSTVALCSDLLQMVIPPLLTLARWFERERPGGSSERRVPGSSWIW